MNPQRHEIDNNKNNQHLVVDLVPLRNVVSYFSYYYPFKIFLLILKFCGISFAFASYE